MNPQSAGFRKLIYTAVIGVLLIPIVYLGQPASSASGNSGGLIARSRLENDLGEPSLGNVDPASTSMSLVLLGMRGVVADLLWLQADREKSMKQWSQLEATIESILLLQPHFQTVWKFQCWNLAYNVSAECDAVADRYFWVKKGLIFLMRGTDRNRMIPELPHDVGDFCGKKIGRADERVFYRKYFVVDPDSTRFDNGPDPRINPDGLDNYLRAREWYFEANDRADTGKIQQHKMDGPLFYSYPYHSLMDFGTAKQQDALTAPLDMLDGLFQDAQVHWAKAYDEWTRLFGRRIFNTAVFHQIQLDGTDEELARLAAEDGMTLEQKKEYRDRYQNTTGYRFWKLRCEVEADPKMAEAHKLLIVGRKQYRDDQDMQGAEETLRQGLTVMESVFKNPKFNEGNGRNRLALDDHDLAEEVIKAMLIYRQERTILGNPIDETEDYTFKDLWNSEDMQGQIKELTEVFQRWQGTGVSQ